MSNIDKVTVGLSVVLGEAVMPIHQLLRMGRGAVISLDRTESDKHLILAEEIPIALGSVEVDHDKITLRICDWLEQAGKPISPSSQENPEAESESESVAESNEEG